jgi:hypothetical protein
MVMVMASGCSRDQADAERAAATILDKALGGPGLWRAETLNYDERADRLTLGGFRASVALAGLPGLLSELGKASVTADSVTFRGLAGAGDLERALGSPDWRGRALKLAYSVEIEDAVVVPGPLVPYGSGPWIRILAGHVMLEGPALLDPVPGTGPGPAGYLRNLSLDRVLATEIAASTARGEAALVLNSWESEKVGFTGPPGESGVLLDVILSRTASLDRASGLSIAVRSPGGPLAEIYLSKAIGSDIRGLGSAGSFALTGLSANLDGHGIYPDAEVAAERIAARGLDATPLLRKAIARAVTGGFLAEKPGFGGTGPAPSGGDSDGTAAGRVDRAASSGPETRRDPGPKSGGATGPDAGGDAGADARRDPGPKAGGAPGPVASGEAGADARRDHGPKADGDPCRDAGGDAGADAREDHGQKADGGPGRDAGGDAGAEARGDASSESRSNAFGRKPYRGVATLADIFTLPFSLGSATLSGIKVTSPGVEAGLASFEWQGPAEAGRLYDSTTRFDGLYLKSPGGEAPEWLGRAARAAKILGIDEFRADILLRTDSDPGTGTVAYDMEKLDVRGLFALSSRARFSGIDQGLCDFLAGLPFSDRDELFASLIGPARRVFDRVGVAELALAYTDASFADRLVKGLGAGQEGLGYLAGMPDDPLHELAAQLCLQVNPAFLEALHALALKPGTFEASYRPEIPLTAEVYRRISREPDPAESIRKESRLYLSVGGGEEIPLFE